MTVWDLSAGVFLVAFVVHGARAAWRDEPSAPWWRKAVNVKDRSWTWVDVALLAAVVVTLVMSGNGDALLHR